ncbi:cystine ABC transporter substrate-binding protein [Telmatospirillum siberiense]|uniref:Cystine ABC transporter substrate-binding protein n=1 Tax=Telmatospirillum siberiense TaxID=382514 RepID=A0A2N3PX23_9PROT|nr:cystine ABC transporter substrate-binding protein [Telmatospirillum siberiense]PKU24949.1 cystine ABC transporter substrate-binding protein [Telmatospirillum siberiense]
MSFRLSRIVFGAIVLAAGFGIGPNAHAASDTLAKITQRGTLRVGLEGTYPPFNYQDEKGELVGFEVDFANAIAKKLGVKTEFLPTKWDGILAALDAERFDVVINQVTVSSERRQKYDFSQPYTISGIQIITRRGNDPKISSPGDLTGKKVGVVLGTNYEQWLKANSPKTDIRTYDDDSTRNQDLLAGRIDAVLNDRLIVANLVKQYNGEIVASGEPFAKQEQSIAFRKGDLVLRVAVDKAIDELRGDGSLAKISEKWFGFDVTK